MTKENVKSSKCLHSHGLSHSTNCTNTIRKIKKKKGQYFTSLTDPDERRHCSALFYILRATLQMPERKRSTEQHPDSHALLTAKQAPARVCLLPPGKSETILFPSTLAPVFGFKRIIHPFPEIPWYTVWQWWWILESS